MEWYRALDGMLFVLKLERWCGPSRSSHCLYDFACGAAAGVYGQHARSWVRHVWKTCALGQGRDDGSGIIVLVSDIGLVSR